MKLIYQKNYISIQKFNDVEVPDFVILTGINGSGKSHLLESINNKSVVIEGAENARTVLFDYKTFYLENEAVYSARQIIDERNNAWGYLQGSILTHLTNLKNKLGENYSKLVEICKSTGLGLLELGVENINDDGLFKQYKEYKKEVKTFFNQDGYKNNQQAQSIFSTQYRACCSLDEITRENFDEIFAPMQLKNDFLPSQIGKIVWDYYLKYRNNEINEFENEKHGKSYPVLPENDFIKLHGEKPWEIINIILDQFNTIEYRLPSPEGSDYYSDFMFKLKHPSKGFEIDFSALSSGEKVLMALVASIYKTSSDHRFPDILLLDEIDASLHPSMIKNLLDTIDKIFIKNDTKVILVTHSPTTVALASDESIYIMKKDGLNRIEKKSKSEALSILTEGFATLDEGLKIFDEISKKDISIISEGRNVNLIKKALELNSISDIEVISGVEGTSGVSQLRTIFDFLSKVAHTKKVIIVWDCDVKNNFVDGNNTFPFVLPKNQNNSIATKGIENMFDETLFANFITSIKDSKGKEIKSFDCNRKKDFEEFILTRNNKNDFNNFASLITKINEIRNLKNTNGTTS